MKRRKTFKQMEDAFNNSPYYRLLGMEVTDMKKGKSKIRMSFKQELTDFNGVAAAGAIASLANSSVALALLSLVELGNTIITMEFKINFMLPVSGGELSTEANIIHKDSQKAVGVTEVINENDKLVAKLISTFSICPERDLS